MVGLQSKVQKANQGSIVALEERALKFEHNRTARIRHKCRKTTVLSCHRCLINTGVEKMNYISYRLEL